MLYATASSTVYLNRFASSEAASSAGFGRITRGWRNEDVVHIYLPMPVRSVLAHPGVAEDRDRAAFQRGPLVFALERVDKKPNLDRLRVPLDAPVRTAFSISPESTAAPEKCSCGSSSDALGLAPADCAGRTSQ